ncbi:hypothetical protein Goklo_005294 [Gossypium klotzschianum]|uniref:F-box associated beta-propeller type 1 domain-containing protein n=1 Tax=Gossypium klotzschianum TaxID=34286 RepID=A0A7J8VSP5_9ROSI|nr:hypothetical protein [Gossypium klotzschianum]
MDYGVYRIVVILWTTSTREFKILPPSLLPHPSFLNPSTNEFKILLPPLVRRPPSRGYLTLQHVMYNDAAFGFDSETDNYKFIRFVTLNFDSEQEISDFRFASQVELYSLKSDSWKEISLPNFDIPQPLEWGTYLDGIFYWKIMMREDKDAIVSFDIANEKFSILLMSEFVGCYTEDPYRVKLLVLNGSLGAIVYPSTYIAIEPWIAPENYFHFWVMNGEAWTIQFSIESVPEVSHPLEFWKTGELFLTSTNNEIVLLDISTQELKKLRIDTCLDVYAHYISLFAYVESLVLIKSMMNI